MEETFITTDTAVAALLQISGIKLLRINKTPFPASFVFVNSEKALSIVSEFKLGIAEGNIFQFHRAWRNLISEVKTGDSFSDRK